MSEAGDTMPSTQLDKRGRVMQRSMALGHCICDMKQLCPCDTFKLHGVCLGAGERISPGEAPVRLTEYVRNAGSAAKISKGVLQEVLGGLPQISDPRVVVGAADGDDAGVMMLSPDAATILTVDLFCPAVDDPFTFGQIAAASALSDIYAMGGVPQVALSIIGFPIHLLPASAMREILRGGIEKMREAGVPIIGGHSINDSEVKSGFAVVGTSPKDAFVRNTGAQVGDAIVLTKPLGTGIVAFAHQLGLTLPGVIESAAKSMAQLNRRAGELMSKFGAHAATDVTGFSLLGHLADIVRNSGVEVELDFDRMPLFKGVADLAERDCLPGAVDRNRDSVDEKILDLSGLTSGQQATLFCPETSGGLLVILPAERAEVFIKELGQAESSSACIIGRVTARREGGFIRVTSSESRPEGYYSVDSAPKPPQAEASPMPAAAPAPIPIPQPAAPLCNHEPAGALVASTPETGNGAWPAPAGAASYTIEAICGGGAISAKHKRLMALALSITSRCELCLKSSTKAAREAGATDEEISEAVAMGIAFAGAPAAMFYSNMRSR